MVWILTVVGGAATLWAVWPMLGSRGRRWLWLGAGVLVLVVAWRLRAHWLALSATAAVALGRKALPLVRFLPLSSWAASWGNPRTRFAGGASSESRRDAAGEDDHNQRRRANRSRHEAMTRHEALAILGLQEGASQADIIREYRKLMKKIHPDHGGSGYLASKVNQARDVLS